MFNKVAQYATLDKYIIGRTLGTGHNSKVKIALEPSQNKYYAIKIIKRGHPAFNLKNIRKEVETLSTINHANIVNLIEFFESTVYIKKNQESYQVAAIVMDLVENGDVFNYLAVAGRFPEEVARSCFRSLIETLEGVHDQGIAHRDLKLENLLFDSEFNMKIGDFELAAQYRNEEGLIPLKEQCGTPEYFAPEIHYKVPYDGAAVDVFNCGIILFLMVCGFQAFERADPRKDKKYLCFAKKNYGPVWEYYEKCLIKCHAPTSFLSEEFKDLINGMFAYQPDERLTLEQIKAHPWYNGDVIDEKTRKRKLSELKANVEAELKREKQREKEKKKVIKRQQQLACFSGFRKMTVS